MSDEEIKKAVTLWLAAVVVLEKGESLLVSRDYDGEWEITVNTTDSGKLTSGEHERLDEAYDALLAKWA
jgi:hypothetical protein